MPEIFTKEQAKASDRVHAELQMAVYRAEEALNVRIDRIHGLAGDRKAGRPKVWQLPFEDAHEAVWHKAKHLPHRSEREHADDLLRTYWEATQELRRARNELTAHDEWEKHGRWSRFFLVTGGHIHSSTRCHTLYPTTQIGWLPELSGESEAEAVKAHGALLCTVCFPSAPVEWTDGRKPDDDLYCPGQWAVPGSYDPRLYRVYGTCDTCGERVSMTSTMKLRKHKKPA